MNSFEEGVVSITAWHPEARQIPVEEIDPRRHRVFDTHGGTHALFGVRVNRRGVAIIREDGVASWHQAGSSITVVES